MVKNRSKINLRLFKIKKHEQIIQIKYLLKEKKHELIREHNGRVSKIFFTPSQDGWRTGISHCILLECILICFFMYWKSEKLTKKRVKAIVSAEVSSGCKSDENLRKIGCLLSWGLSFEMIRTLENYIQIYFRFIFFSFPLPKRILDLTRFLFFSHRLLRTII